MKIRITDLLPCRGVALTRSRVLPALVAALGLLPAGRVAAQTFTTLYSFTATSGPYPGTNSDGAGPSGLILSGNTMYGTASGGGSSGAGTVFAVNTDGTGFTNLHSFDGGSDGAHPQAGLVLSGTTLYGTAYNGSSSHFGSVFAVNTDGTGFTNLHSFAGVFPPNFINDEGAFPTAGLVLSGSTLYGTVYQGGSSGRGTVFAVNTDGTGFTNLHSFTGSGGDSPNGGLILSGNTLYGTAAFGGGSGDGTVFAVNTNGTGFTNVYSFTASGGAFPRAGLILSSNTLYGTTENGGNSSYGTVFAVNTDGTGFTTLHSFTVLPNTDGARPEAGLILSGNTLYGTASEDGSSGGGTVFAINTDGTGFITLRSFTFPAYDASTGADTNSDGAFPYAGLVLSRNTLYGTAKAGGGSGHGTVFSLSLGPASTPAPTLTIFPSGADVFLTWPTNAAGFTLQSAAAVTDTFTNIPGATSPYSNHITGAQQFFRLISN